MGGLQGGGAEVSVIPMANDSYGLRQLPDGRRLEVIALTYGRARLCVGPPDKPIYDNMW